MPTAINQLLADQVSLNLNHHQLWSDVKEITIYIDNDPFVVCSGRPREKIHPDDPEPNPLLNNEYVVPVPTEGKWSIRKMTAVFEQLEKLQQTDIPRVIMGMVTNDSTVMYYISAKGLVKPRKN